MINSEEMDEQGTEKAWPAYGFVAHWPLRPGDPLVPEEVYAKGRVVQLPRWQGWAKAAKEKLDEMMGAA
jgi:hypothetical protein